MCHARTPRPLFLLLILMPVITSKAAAQPIDFHQI